MLCSIMHVSKFKNYLSFSFSIDKRDRVHISTVGINSPPHLKFLNNLAYFVWSLLIWKTAGI